MHAIVLAAGVGKRLQPLTDSVPKALLEVGGRTLIECQLERLARGGVKRVAINLFHLGELVCEALGDGSRFGLEIAWSAEQRLLDTAGGIIQAWPLLGGDAAIVTNADVWTDFDYAGLQRVDGKATLAHLVLVPNPPSHPQGDFFLGDDGRVSAAGGAGQRLTFAGLSVLHRKLFAGLVPEPLPLAPLLRSAMAQGRVSGERHDGDWVDVGTPERLAELNSRFCHPPS